MSDVDYQYVAMPEMLNGVITSNLFGRDLLGLSSVPRIALAGYSIVQDKTPLPNGLFCQVGDLIVAYTGTTCSVSPGGHMWHEVSYVCPVGRRDVTIHTMLILKTGLRIDVKDALYFTAEHPVGALLRLDRPGMYVSEKTQKINDWPRQCPACNGPAYFGLNDIMCKMSCQPHLAAR